jgi:cytochrome b subunit of formate dehydrogenase
MNKQLLQKYWIDVGLAISFLIVFITGLIKWPAFVGNFGFSRTTLYVLMLLHDFSGLLMGILVLIHIIQHWKWIVSMTKNIFKKKVKNE